MLHFTSQKPSWTKELTVECLKGRALRAIKRGNHETKYIIEACKAEFWIRNLYKALDELTEEGKIILHKEELDSDWYTLA